MMSRSDLELLARKTAAAYQLDPALVCAVVEQESAWNPFSIRFEPAFYTKYIAPLNLPGRSEPMARAFSWGLMQVMGQVAREAGFKGEYLSMLCEPAAGLDIGCRVLRAKLNTHPQNVTAGLLAWNGGSRPEYAPEVLARVDKYKGVTT